MDIKIDNYESGSRPLCLKTKKKKKKEKESGKASQNWQRGTAYSIWSLRTSRTAAF